MVYSKYKTMMAMAIRQMEGHFAFLIWGDRLGLLFCGWDLPWGVDLPEASRHARLAQKYACSVLSLLVGRQQGHPICKKTECWCLGGGDLTGALHYHHLHYSISITLAELKSSMVCHSGTGLSWLC